MMNEELARQEVLPVGDMLTAIRDSVRDADWYYSRAERAFDARECVWTGQSVDGRKHAEDLGYDPFPWEGASDIRPRTVDEVVNEQVMTMWQAFSRGKVQVTGMETSDMAWGKKVSALLKYLVWQRMRGQVRRELCLAANWRQTYGSAVLSVMWEQELRRGRQEVTVDGLAVLVGNPEEMSKSPEALQAAMDEARNIVLDPLREDEAIAVLRGLSEILTVGQARKALNELREAGVTMIVVPEVYAALPRWTALMPMVDVFFPVDTDDIQRARWVAHRERISEVELLDRIETAGYDEEWVKLAIARRGQTFNEVDKNRLVMSERRRHGYGDAVEDRDALEIFHFYHKSVGADGLPVLTCSVASVAVNEMLGKSEELPYEHGKYPYVVMQREHSMRTILESRGVAELADTWQNDIKIQQDARTDRTQLTVLPPLIVPPSIRGHLQGGASQVRLPLMPGSQLGARRNESFEWMRTPPYDPGSVEIERSQLARIDRYFGRMSETVPPMVTQLTIQDLADGWLLECQEVVEQTLQLAQQYMTDAEVTRIAGALPRPFQTSAEEIRGQFDLMIVFDARDLDAEMLKGKLELLNTMVLVNDRYGRVDMAKWIEVTMASVDPWLAEQTLVPMEEATEKQVLDQLDRLQKMLVGIEPPMEPKPGMNYQLRAQVMQQEIAKNQAMQQRIAGQPDTAALIENEMKFLSFQMQQGENAQIGRVGTEPVMG